MDFSTRLCLGSSPGFKRNDDDVRAWDSFLNIYNNIKVSGTKIRINVSVRSEAFIYCCVKRKLANRALTLMEDELEEAMVAIVARQKSETDAAAAASTCSSSQ